MSYQEEMLKEIANAIREVEGTEDKIPANQFASRVAGLSVAKPSGTKTITENGDYDVSNYAWASVNVEPNLIPKEITENGTYKASDDGADGYSEVVVNVASGGGKPSPFADATPEEIQQIGNEISAKGMTSAEVEETYGWKIGDTKDITLTTGEVIQMRIIGFNHDNLTGGGKAGITLDMVNCLNTNYKMNGTNTNVGGWAASQFRNTTLPTIKATLPTEWQDIIVKVDKKSANGGGGTNYSETLTLSEDVFLLAEIEVFGKATQSQDGVNEGSVYEYWNGEYYKRKKQGSSYVIWWLRSSSSISTNAFAVINSTNNASGYGNASDSWCVSFAFCVGSSPAPVIAGLPIEVTTDTDMTNALVEDNLGKVYKFTGTSDTYETDAIYIVSEVE